MKDLDVIFKALADVNRVRILKLLGSRKMCVCEIAVFLQIFVEAGGVVLRGKEIKGASSLWAPVSMINGVDE